MFTFLLQFSDSLAQARVHYFVIFFLFAWTLWFLKLTVSRFYRPSSATFAGTASVVIPVVDEHPVLFGEVLTRIAAQNPQEILVVINGPRNEPLEETCRRFPTVQVIGLPEPGKRMAIREGVQKATGEIVVLVDSDTLWEPDALGELLKPFADPKIGGVTTNQRIWEPERSFWTRFADWMEEMRGAYGMPAMSVFRTVGCLPGRTIAFRREILLNALPEFLNESFLGTHLEISDDRALTNYCLRAGYGTVLQQTSRVTTDAPTTVGKFIRQQLRWARGSQYNTLKMLPWMLSHARFLAVLYLCDTIVPFFLMGVFFNTGWNMLFGQGCPWADLTIPEHIAIALAGGTAGLMIRRPSRLRDFPREILCLPVYWFLVSFLLAPLRIWGFMRMAYDEGWGTREAAYQGSTKRSSFRLVPMAIAVALLAFFMALGPLMESLGASP